MPPTRPCTAALRRPQLRLQQKQRKGQRQQQHQQQHQQQQPTFYHRRLRFTSSSPVFIYILLYLLLPFLHLLSTAHLASALSLTIPHSVSSVNGTLDTILLLTETSITLSNGLSLTTRLYNGTFPGPTLRVRRGDVLRVRLINALSDQGIPYIHNRASAPDETNLHLHGLHVSSLPPSDSPRLVVRPGQSYDYEVALPDTHMGGTHWYHPHRHGSASLQVSGGAAGLLIVDDDNNDDGIPQQVVDASEVLFIVQPLNVRGVRDIADEVGDEVFRASQEDAAEVVLINGVVRPKVSDVRPGEWVRVRVAYAGWEEHMLEIRFDSRCDTALLAKDGVYIRDFPRMLPSGGGYIPLGGRADFMVRCPSASTTYNIIGGVVIGRRRRNTNILATLTTKADMSNNNASANDLQTWTPTYPDYLTDLRSTPPTAGCNCTTRFANIAVNGMKFPANDSDYLHSSPLGSVLSRTLRATGHPYHQHVYPFQLVSAVRVRDALNADGFYKVGDWHDTFDGNVEMRYQPNRFATHVMVHCHRLRHEDAGMMAQELVFNASGEGGGEGRCECGRVEEAGRRGRGRGGGLVGRSGVVGSVVVGLFFVGLVTWFGVSFVRKTWPFKEKVMTAAGVVIVDEGVLRVLAAREEEWETWEDSGEGHGTAGRDVLV